MVGVVLGAMDGAALGAMDGVALGEGVNGAAVGSGEANGGGFVGAGIGGVPSKLVMSFCLGKFLWSRMVTPFTTSE